MWALHHATLCNVCNQTELLVTRLQSVPTLPRAEPGGCKLASLTVGGLTLSACQLRRDLKLQVAWAGTFYKDSPPPTKVQCEIC